MTPRPGGATSGDPALDQYIRAVLGHRDDPLCEVAGRAAMLRPDATLIVWEADSLLYRFSYISPVVAEVLGHPLQSWMAEEDFWLRRVVHGADRADVIAICALSVGRQLDRSFQYRALASDGSIVVMHTTIVARGPHEGGARMRGVMVERSREARSDPGA
jgi:hypothetical protein